MKSKYLHNKKKLIRIYSSVVSDMRVDNTDKKISSVNIQNIGEGISNFSKRLEELQVLFQDIQSRYSRDDFIGEEGEWLLEFSNNFTLLLEGWLLFHKSELEKLSDSVGDISENTEIQSLEQSLLLHQGVLHTQMNQIEKLL